MEELIYGSSAVAKLIKQNFANATFADASDEIHEYRFEVSIPEITKLDFYKFAIKEGFAGQCFILQLLMYIQVTEEDKALVKELVRYTESLT